VSPALELFLDRAAAADAAFVADDAAVAGALAVCREVGGLPLAIELAAARVASVPPAVMAAELARTGGLTLLSGGATNGPDRHRSLEAALRWTYELLPPPAADVFARLSVFEAPATVEAVAVVAAPANDVLELLSVLVDVQLVDLDVADPQQPLFSLGRPMRAFAAEQLLRQGAPQEAQRRHDDYFRLRARAGGILPVREVPDLVATLDRIVLEGHIDTALEAALRASHHVASPGAGAALEARIAALIEHPGADPGLEARALAWTTVHGGSGATDHQVYAQWTSDRVRQALRTARESGDTPALLAALELTIRTVPTTLDRDLAVASLQEGLALAERSGDERMLAHFRLWAGMLAHASGQAPMAIGLLGAALDVGTALHDSLVTEYAGMFLLGVEADGTPTGRELPDPRELLQSASQRGDAWAATWLCTLLASLSLAEDALAPAAEYAGQLLSLGVQRQAVEPIFGPIGITVAVRVLVAAGELEQAACLAAAITPLAEMLPRSMPVRYWSAYTDSLAALLALPADQRMAAEHRGNALSIGEAVPLAQQWVWAMVADRRPAPVQAPDMPAPGPESLTQREREVLVLLGDGASNPQIGRALGISGKTVMHHTMSIYRKLGVRGRAEAAAWVGRHVDGASG
jgi:DNA-binding CsgD family transcriptional regulator